MSLSGLPPRHTSSPKHWLDRAKKARNAAKTMGDLSLRILEVAVGNVPTDVEISGAALLALSR
jgi:hypothetical protein